MHLLRRDRISKESSLVTLVTMGHKDGLFSRIFNGQVNGTKHLLQI